MIIGLTGPNASGKGVAAIYLKSKGFVYHSLSDALREEAKTRRIEPAREKLIELGNDLRRKHGASFLADKVIERLSAAKDHIVDSIRNPAEVDVLRETGDFRLIGIDAPVELRFKRAQNRKRPGDPETIEEFIDKEKRENIDNAENQQLRRCMKLADTVIINDSSLEDLQRKIDEAIKET